MGILSMRQLQAHLHRHPADWEAVAHGISDLLLMGAGAHADLLIESSRNRVAATLLRLGGNRHRRYPQCVPRLFECTQDELARATGLSRNTAGLHLRTLERQGHIGIGYGQIAILNPQALAAMADSDS